MLNFLLFFILCKNIVGDTPKFLWFLQILNGPIFQISSGIASGRVLDGELLYTEILEANKLTSRISVDSRWSITR